MSQLFPRITILGTLWANAFAQPATRPSFDISDVHLSAPATNPDTFVSGGLFRNGRYDLRRATLLDLIRIAYGFDAAKVVGGPSWLAFDRFDISAKAPESTSPETTSLMIRSLLTDRFNLVLHEDSRPLPAFALIRTRQTPKLKLSDSSASQSGCQTQPQAPNSAFAVFACRNVTMAAFAASLRRIAGDYLAEPVIDSTRLEGTWDFDLKWNPRPRLVASDRVTIFDAIEQQLGLKLELQQTPVPVIVIDRVNQKPTPNAPDVARALPPRSLEFEVAAIKQSSPDARFGYKRFPAGRLEIHAFPMKMLIATAWDIDWDHMDERIVEAPRWVDSKRFDITANTAATPDVPQGTGFIDEEFQLRLRALLTERFKIASHYEDRPVAAYTLAATRPKLTMADPASRSGCSEAHFLPNDPRDRNPKLSRLIQCRNVTMAQFALQLQTLDRVEATANLVVDETGLTGAWDFTISFTPKRLLEQTTDPDGSISFFDALRQQLGLKLEPRKRPMPVLVIDHIEEMT